MLALPYLGELSPFGVGVLGSLCVEVGAAAKATLELEGKCPQRYKKPFYLLVRVLLALAAGAIPIIFEAANSLTAFYLGASAPLILDRFSRGVDPSRVVQGKDDG